MATVTAHQTYFYALKTGQQFLLQDKYGMYDTSLVYTKNGPNSYYAIDPKRLEYINSHTLVLPISSSESKVFQALESWILSPVVKPKNQPLKHGGDMQVYLNKVPIELKQSNFLATGGQGSVYVKGNTAYKIYLDSQKAIPKAKIKELGTLSNMHIIRPMDILENGGGEYIGYTMQFVKDTIPLCQIVSKIFKDRHGIKPDTTLNLIRQLQQLMEFVHSRDMLMIDINDLNYLVTKNFKELYAIDVDSYQTPSFPATAIMETIRDQHNTKFSKETDYFSFGVTSFQTLIGLHPYRGSHPDYEKYPLKDRLKRRMRDNVSVFHTGISMPNACLPLDIIPQALKDWYISIFESNKREAPPTKYASAPRANLVVKTIQHDKLKVSCVKKLGNDSVISRLYYMAGRMFEICDSQQYMSLSNHGTPITLRELDDRTEWGDINGQNSGFFKGVTKLFNVDQNIYGVMGNKLVKLNFLETGKFIIGGLRTIGSMVGSEDGSNIFQGCIIQNILGRQTIYIMDGNSLHQVPLPELDGMIIIDAKYQNRVLVTLVTDRKTQECHRHVFRFKAGYTYDVRTVKDVDPAAGVVFTISHRGIVVLKNEDDKLEIFHSDPNSTNMNVIPLNTLEIGDLWSICGDILFTRNNEIHKIAL